MFSACIFDLDGTLANTISDLADAMNFSLKNNGFPIHETEKYKKFVGNGINKLIERAAPSVNEENFSKLKSDFDKYYSIHSIDKTKAYDGCYDLLKKLNENNIICCVLSNKPNQYVENILKKLYPNIIFDKYLGKLPGYEPKPNPDLLNKIIQDLKINKNECLYIGDSDVDIITAKRAELKSCGVLWGFRDYEELKGAGADYIANTPLDILNIVYDRN